MKPKDIKNKPPNILLYGPAGSGKTALVAQATNGYLFDFDDGMLTAKTVNDKFRPLRWEIDFDSYVDENPAKPHMWIEARKKLKSIVEQANAGKWKHDALIIDSLTGMARCIQLHVMSCAGDSYKKPEIQHWGSMVQEMETALTMIRAVRVLRLTTAHELLVEKQATKSLVPVVDYITPLSVTRKHSIGKLMWLFDEVWYTSLTRGAQGKMNFTVDSKPATSHRCRTRCGLVQTVVHNEMGLVGLLEKAGYKYGT
jgi:archaellum biogenesis ATPase FlaH